jgi:hypothetical protein
MAARFREGLVEADGSHPVYGGGGRTGTLFIFRTRGFRLSPAHKVLSRNYRVAAFETLGFGASAENRSIKAGTVPPVHARGRAADAADPARTQSGRHASWSPVRSPMW